MFNLQGSEIIFILLIALVVLGPEKLPGAIRRVTSLYAELRKLSSGFQDEFKSALDEPLREMKSTADLMKHAADPKWIAEEAEREAELAAAAEKKARQARDTTEAMEAAGAAHLAESAVTPTADVEPSVDAFADPVDPNEVEATASDAESVEANPEREPQLDTTASEAEPAIGDAEVAGLSSTDLDFEREGKSA